MRLEKHIADLLKFNRFVVVPGLGSFISTYVSSSFNEESNRFFPPENQIVFNSQISKNDGVLASYLSKKESISYQESESIIFKYVDTTLDSLSKGTVINLNNLGTLSMDRHGNLVFEPTEKKDVFPLIFGLSDFEMTPLSKLQQKQFHLETRPMVDRVIKTRPFVRVAASVSLLIALSVLPFQNKQNYSFTDANLVNQIFNDKPLVEKKAIADNVANTSAYQNNQSLNFQLIAGSFKSLKNAEQLIEELKNEGFTPKTIELDNGYIRVSMNSYPTIEEAKIALDKYMQNHPKSKIWINKNS